MILVNTDLTVKKAKDNKKRITSTTETLLHKHKLLTIKINTTKDLRLDLNNIHISEYCSQRTVNNFCMALSLFFHLHH